MFVVYVSIYSVKCHTLANCYLNIYLSLPQFRCNMHCEDLPVSVCFPRIFRIEASNY